MVRLAMALHVVVATAGPMTAVAAVREVVARPTVATAPPPTKPLDLSPATIREAIASSKRPEDDVRSAGGATFGAAPTTRAASIDRAFRDAEIPTCMTPEAFRFDPPVIVGIPLPGFFALPVWAHAIATGKCRH